MLKEGKFGVAEGISILSVLLIAKIFLGMPRQVLELGKTGAWMIPLIATFVALVGFFFLALYMKRFPNKTLVEATNETLGSIGGTILNYYFLLVVLIMTALMLRQFAERIILTALPFYPISLISIFFMLVMILAAYKGLEPIARSLFITSPFIVAAVFVVLFLLFPYYHIHNIFPFFGDPVKIGTGGLWQSSLFVEVLFLPLIMPVLQGWKNFVRIGVSSIVLTGCIYTVFIFIFLLVFPYEAGIEITSPYYVLARTVFLGRFVQRFESIFLLIWVFIGVAHLSLMFYGTLAVSARIWRLKSIKPLIPGYTIVILALSLLAPNMEINNWLSSLIFRTFGWIPSFAVPIFLLIVAILRKKGAALEN